MAKIDNTSLLVIDIDNELSSTVFNSEGGWWEGEGNGPKEDKFPTSLSVFNDINRKRSENDPATAIDDDDYYYDIISTSAENVINNAVEFFLNNDTTRSAINSNLTNEHIKFLSPLNNNSIFQGDIATYENISYNLQPRFPDYIIVTSMVFCITIMCLGLIGNIMVNLHK